MKLIDMQWMWNFTAGFGEKAGLLAQMKQLPSFENAKGK